jgi:hypothetical protein
VVSESVITPGDTALSYHYWRNVPAGAREVVAQSAITPQDTALSYHYRRQVPAAHMKW